MTSQIALSSAVAAVLMLAACQQTQRATTSNTGSADRATPISFSTGSNSGTVTPSGRVESYADVVARAFPAVVTIRSARRVRAPQQFPFADDPFFQRFFGSRLPQGGATQVEHALGSGVIVRKDGYILTNHHVVDGAEEIKVDFSNRRTYSAKLVGSDAPSDLALLKVDANDLQVLPLGNSDQVRIGDIVLAIGNPLGIGETVTAGIISAKGRATGLSDGSFQDFLQTDAPINQGNSGGALINTRAELIGINSQILSPSGGNIGIGFAIPTNMAATVMNQLVSHGSVRRGLLGVGVQPVTSDLAASLGLKDVRGILVNSVTSGGPADQAGIKSGDVITAINGTAVNDTNLLRNMVASTAPGTDLPVTILRNGSEQQVHVKVGELNANNKNSGGESGGGAPTAGKLGLSLEPLTPEIASQLGLARGARGLVVDSVDPAGAAANAGVQQGDVIQQVNRQPVSNADDVRSALAKSGDRPPLLLINRRGQTIFLAVPLH